MPTEKKPPARPSLKRGFVLEGSDMEVGKRSDVTEGDQVPPTDPEDAEDAEGSDVLLGKEETRSGPQRKVPPRISFSDDKVMPVTPTRADKSLRSSVVAYTSETDESFSSFGEDHSEETGNTGKDQLESEGGPNPAPSALGRLEEASTVSSPDGMVTGNPPPSRRNIFLAAARRGSLIKDNCGVGRQDRRSPAASKRASTAEVDDATARDAAGSGRKSRGSISTVGGSTAGGRVWIKAKAVAAFSLAPPALASGPIPHFISFQEESESESDDGTGAHAEKASYRCIAEAELQKAPPFASCAADFVAHLAKTVSVSNYPQNGHVCTRGERGSSLLLVLNGVLTGIIQGEAVMKFQPGSYFGETNMLGLDDQWSFSVVADTPCTLCEVSRHNFMEVLSKHPSESLVFQDVLEICRLKRKVNEGVTSNPCALFKGMAQEGLEFIEQRVVHRIFFKGQRLMEEGVPSCGLLILVYGTAAHELCERTVACDVEDSVTGDFVQDGSTWDSSSEDEAPAKSIDSRVKTVGKVASLSVTPRDSSRPSAAAVSARFKMIEAPKVGHTCFGEGEVLGIQDSSSSTITCRTTCHVKVLHKKVLQSIIVRKGALLANSVLMLSQEKITVEAPMRPYASEGCGLDGVTSALLASFVKAECAWPFLEFLSKHLEERFYNEDQDLLTPHDILHKSMLHVIRIGSVQVLRERLDVEGRRFEELPHPLVAGETFGGIPCVGAPWRPQGAVNIRPLGMWCCTRILHRSVVIRGLELHPAVVPQVLVGASENAPGISVIDVFKRSKFFAGMHANPLDEFCQAVETRIFMPGDDIVTQGDCGTSMFILIAGCADILMEQQKRETLSSYGPSTVLFVVGQINPGSAFGELAMLGVAPTRTATVRAAQVCMCGEVSREKALGVLEKFPLEREIFSDIIKTHLQSTIPKRIVALSLFAGQERKVLDRLVLHAEDKVFFPEEYIFREGQRIDSMYILNLGSGYLMKLGCHIKSYGPGKFVGVENMLGFTKTACTSFFVNAMTHTLGISQQNFKSAVAACPNAQVNTGFVNRQRMVYSHFLAMVQQVTARKRTWTRFQTLMFGQAMVSEEQMKKNVLYAWSGIVSVMDRRRRRKAFETAQREETLREYLKKKEQAMHRVEDRDWQKNIVHKMMTDRSYHPKELNGCTKTRPPLREPNESPPPPPVPPALPDNWPKLRAPCFYRLCSSDVVAATACRGLPVDEVAQSGVAQMIATETGGKKQAQKNTLAPADISKEYLVNRRRSSMQVAAQDLDGINAVVSDMISTTSIKLEQPADDDEGRSGRRMTTTELALPAEQPVARRPSTRPSLAAAIDPSAGIFETAQPGTPRSRGRAELLPLLSPAWATLGARFSASPPTAKLSGGGGVSQRDVFRSLAESGLQLRLTPRDAAAVRRRRPQRPDS